MQKLITKIAGVALAVALFVGVAVPAASALTSAEITALLIGAGIDANTAAVLAAALGESNTTTSDTGVCAITRDLTIGATGADVVTLQDTLIANNFLVIPAGVSKGYFGTITESAVAQWQMSLGVTPASGYFGSVTRGAIASSCTTTVVDNGGSSNNGSSSSSVLGSGEASLESFELNDDEDEVAEGESEVVAVVEFDVEDGDVEVQRLDLTFATNTNEEDEPWDAFEEIRLLVDGDEIASADVSDEDDWLDEDGPYVFRFSGLDYVVMDGDTAEIEIEVTAADSVDGADGNDAEWTISIEANDIRAIDGEGIDQYAPRASEVETVTFDIVSEGEGDDLDLESSSDDPDESTIILSEDDNVEAEIFAFELSADDSDNDIEINEIVINLGISSTTGALEDVVNDIYIEIDGDKFTPESYSDDYDSTSITFDIDGDFTIDADETATVVVFVEFEDMEADSEYQGITISASTTQAGIDAEGNDDVTVDGSTQTSEAHTLRSEGIFAEVTSVEEDTQGQDDEIGVFTIKFEVSAFGDDFYIDDSAATTVTAGIEFGIEGGAVSTGSATLSSSADEEGSSFLVEEGETETFTLKVNVTTNTGADFRVVLEKVLYDTEDMATDSLPDNTYNVTPVEDSRTDYEFINVSA